MGAIDNMKDKAADAVQTHGDKIDEGMDKGGDMADEKTGGKHTEKIDQGVERGKDAMDKMGQ